MSRVQSLNLSDNNLTKFAFSNSTVFSNLLYLDLKRNNFSNVPRNIASYAPKLLELDLSENQITELRKRDFLDESGIQIGIPSLFMLVLSRNKIALIAENVFEYGFSNLRRLYLDHNLIGLSYSWIFNGLDNLILLDLKFNRIETIPGESLRFSRHLSFIYLDHNEIEEMWSMSMVGLQLTQLTLSHNKIAKIDQFALCKGYIQNLDLSFNNIRSMPLQAFGSIIIVHLSLKGNPMKCDCYLKSMLLKTSNRDVKGNCFSTHNSTISDVMNQTICDGCSTFTCEEHATCKLSLRKTPICVCKYGNVRGSDHKCGKPVCHGSRCQQTNTHSTELSSNLSTTVVAVISVSAFLVGALGSFIIYHRFIRPANSGELKYTPFYINPNNK